MPLLLICLLLSSSSNNLNVAEFDDRWVGEDKLEHAFVSAFLLGATYFLSHYEFGISKDNANKLGIGISISAGISKELYDQKTKGRMSLKDVCADLAGVIIGILIFVR